MISDNTKLWLITITVMLAAVMEMLDMTIVNVSLPNMMASLNADSNQITWVLTSYIIGTAIFTPLTGLLIKRLGAKRLLLTNMIGFMIVSMLCGFAATLWQMVVFRSLQGVFGAALVPLSQFILRSTFTPKEQGKAMAIWGVGIMSAPVFGPTIGAFITDHLTWRWVFYMNLPICLVTGWLAYTFIEETPRLRVKIDWVGLMLMAIGVGCLQAFLDQGSQKSWLNSTLIVSLMLISGAALVIFIVRGINCRNHIVNLSLFRERQFATSVLIVCVYCLGVISTIAIQPLLLETVIGYPIKTAGLMMAPRGISSAVAMVCAVRLLKHFDYRILVSTGIALSGIGVYAMTKFTTQLQAWDFIWPTILQGLGMGLFFVPLSTYIFAKLDPQSVGEGAGLFNFARNIGGSMGISLISTILTRKAQLNWWYLGGHLHPDNIALQAWLSAHQLKTLTPQAAQELAYVVYQQAHMTAFLDAFFVISVATLLILPLVWLLAAPSSLTSRMG